MPRSPIRLTSCGAYVFGWNLIPADLWERLPEQHRDYRVVRRFWFGWVVVKAGRTPDSRTRREGERGCKQ